MRDRFAAIDAHYHDIGGDGDLKNPSCLAAAWALLACASMCGRVRQWGYPWDLCSGFVCCNCPEGLFSAPGGFYFVAVLLPF